MTRERTGTLLCLIAALAYSTQPIFAKFAYAASVGVLTLLVVRYLVSATAFWAILRARAVPLPARPLAIRAALLGCCGTSVQVFLFATALTRLDAALGSLLLYSFPAMIAAGAIISGQERPSARRFLALAIASAGVVLVIGVAGGRAWDPLGVALALSSAFGAALYFLISHRLLARVAPLPLATLGESGAGLAFLLAGIATGRLDFTFAPWGWWATLGLAVASASALLASLSGMARVGPTTTGIVMMAETPLTVALAYLTLGERLSPPQLAGGALVLAAVVLLQVASVAPPTREISAPAPPAPL